ncbi:MAG: hypothetical protein LQ338_007683 [Usnochroma carphineum]|nr:MAG: hypothetical protein LQ338_007683 [Usnochroma carphineum]
MPMDEKIQTLWTGQIKSRLRAVLLRSIPRGTCVQEFMMVGKRPESLRPTLVITCGDTATKKLVEKTFRSQNWLQELLKANHIMFVAMVAEVCLSAGPDADNASTVKLSGSYAVQVPPSGVMTACGLDLLIHGADDCTPRHCTLGGLIVVNGETLGLTAGHPFSKIRRERIPWEHLDVDRTVGDSGDEEDSTASSEPFVFNGDDDDDNNDANGDSSASTSSLDETDVLPPPTDGKPHRRSEASRPSSPSINWYSSQAAILPASNPARITPADDLLTDHDWALLEALPPIVTSRPNKVAHIDLPRDFLVEGIVSGPACGEVTITTGGIGPQSGYLHSSPATMKVDKFVLEVHLITLERILRKF